MGRPTQLDPRIGSEVAGYRVERLLGRGGMSVVYLAEQVRLKRPAALKLLAPELADDERFRERFLRESELAASLDHPSVIPIYDAGEVDGQLYIAMRYVEGSDLRALLLSEGKLEPERTLRVLRPVADALDYAHAHGLVHRDVKPGNILLAADGPVYLSDFGLTRRVDEGASLTEAGELVGSIDYAAPEQIEGGAVDGRSDIYSLACVFYECLTGSIPFPRDSAMAKLWAHLRDAPPAPSAVNPTLSTELDAVLARGLAKQPNDRYKTATELVEDLQGVVTVDSGAAVPTRKRRRTLLVLGLGAFAAIAGLTAALVLTLGGEGARQTPALPLTGDAVVRIDGASDQVAAAVPVPDPGAIAVGLGSAWVVDQRDIALVRVDPGLNRAAATIPLNEATAPDAIAAGEGAVWLLFVQASNGIPGRWLWKVDPVSGRISRIPETILAFDVAVGGGAVWINDLKRLGSSGAKLLRILPTAFRVAATLPVPTDTIEIGEAGLWCLLTIDATTSTLSHVDPASGAVLNQIDLSFTPASFGVGAGSLWIVDASNDTVLELDPKTGAIRNSVRVGRIPGTLAVGADAVWVANTRDETVSRIDPVTLDVTTISVGGTPSDLAPDDASVYVSVSAD